MQYNTNWRIVTAKQVQLLQLSLRLFCRFLFVLCFFAFCLFLWFLLVLLFVTNLVGLGILSVLDDGLLARKCQTRHLLTFTELSTDGATHRIAIYCHFLQTASWSTDGTCHNIWTSIWLCNTFQFFSVSYPIFFLIYWLVICIYEWIFLLDLQSALAFYSNQHFIYKVTTFARIKINYLIW